MAATPHSPLLEIDPPEIGGVYCEAANRFSKEPPEIFLGPTGGVIVATGEVAVVAGAEDIDFVLVSNLGRWEGWWSWGGEGLRAGADIGG